MEADVASSEEMLQRLEAEKKRHLAELAANRDALDEARQSVRCFRLNRRSLLRALHPCVSGSCRIDSAKRS
jgi:hypothetical protein